jgi:hypothetical protein
MRGLNHTSFLGATSMGSTRRMASDGMRMSINFLDLPLMFFLLWPQRNPRNQGIFWEKVTLMAS